QRPLRRKESNTAARLTFKERVSVVLDDEKIMTTRDGRDRFAAVNRHDGATGIVEGWHGVQCVQSALRTDSLKRARHDAVAVHLDRDRRGSEKGQCTNELRVGPRLCNEAQSRPNTDGCNSGRQRGLPTARESNTRALYSHLRPNEG